MERFKELWEGTEGVAPCPTEGCALWENHPARCTVNAQGEGPEVCYHERADANMICRGCGVQL